MSRGVDSVTQKLKEKKKKLSLDDYSKPTVSAVVASADLEEAPNGIPAQEIIEEGRSPQHHPVKLTVYVTREANQLLKNIYISRFQQDDRVTRAQIWCDAIALLHEKEMSSKN